MKGLFLVIEGGDGSGKSTQRRLLEEFFIKAGRKVEALHFPRLDVKPYVAQAYAKGILVGTDSKGSFNGTGHTSRWTT